MQPSRSIDARAATIPMVGSSRTETDSMYLQPVVRCKNPDCTMPSAARIRLPYPNPPGSTATPPDWPHEGWQLRLICRDCDHWYVYERKDVQWAPFSSPVADHSGLDFWSV